jgi:BirA family transcriptional regulator, biotin operon repressor / biotin---[acetyl-CoA-carboxylase] ligase
MTKPYNVRKLDVTASTNDDAKKAAADGESEGLVIWALQQTKGRGRMGRAWESPKGNLHASILLRPDCSIRQASHYVFVAALALHDAVRAQLTKSHLTLKWPNDVLADGKKIGGILLETSTMGDKLDWLVVGIGLNAEHYPKESLYPATSLRVLGAVPAPLENTLETLLERFYHWKDTLEKQGFAGIRAKWLHHAQKGRLSVRLPKETIEGEFADFDEQGNLVLQLADGSKKAIASGDVFFL